MKVRYPCQAGVFYSSSEQSLIKEIEKCFLHKFGPGSIPIPSPKQKLEGIRKIVGFISPHAGYIYSGPIAAFSFKALAEDGEPKIAVIIGPNHTGIGSGISIMTKGEWKTPLGNLKIDGETAEAIAESSDIIDIDDEAHKLEHSIEVQIPFLQYLYNDRITIVPICMMIQDMETSLDIASSIFKNNKNRDLVVIASSDMTHYEPQRSAIRKDRTALKMITQLDVNGLYNVLNSENISMCGYGPITVLMNYVKLLGKSKGTLTSYKTSGDITGDYSAVVGYASVIF